jgi:hypothetical protein
MIYHIHMPPGASITATTGLLIEAPWMATPLPGTGKCGARRLNATAV